MTVNNAPPQITWEFSPKQSNLLLYILNKSVRFMVIVAGRRFGKTHWACLVMLLWAWQRPNMKIWYIAPTYKQAEGIAWEMLKTLIPPEYIHKINETKLRMTLINKSVIELKGADEPDSLRGPGIDLVLFDEYANIKPEAWDVVRPTLMAQDPPGKAIFVGTPQGLNSFYDLYNSAFQLKNWKAFQYTSMDGGRIPEEELETAKREMDPRIYKQEFLASFESLTGRVYYGFNRQENVWDGVREIGTELFLGCDFNISPMTCVIGSRIHNQLHVFDEIVLQNSNSHEMAAAILERYGDRIASSNIERISAIQNRRSINVYPDASGNSRKTSAVVGETDFTILRRAGLKIFAPRANPPVIDRYNATNALLCNAAGDRNLLIHPRCVNLIKALDGLCYKKGTNVADKSGGHDHLTDALGYLIWGKFNVFKRGVNIQELIL